MRYVGVETVSFEDINGRIRAVKEMREIPSYEIAATVSRTQAEPLDAVACRPDVYGPSSEGLAYKLHEAMAAEITDHRFDYSILRTVRVPA